MWVSVFNVNLGEYARAIGLPSLYIPEGEAKEDVMERPSKVQLAAATGRHVDNWDGWSHDAQECSSPADEFPSTHEWPKADEIHRVPWGCD